MKPIEFFNTIVINRPPDEVFAFVCEVENMNVWLRPPRPPFKWFPFRTRKATDGAFGEGTLFWVDRMGLRVSRFHPNQPTQGFETDSFYFRFPASMIFERTHAELRFEAVDGGTRFTFKRFMTLKPIMKPLERQFQAMTQEQGQLALEKLRSMLEQ